MIKSNSVNDLFPLKPHSNNEIIPHSVIETTSTFTIPKDMVTISYKPPKLIVPKLSSYSEQTLLSAKETPLSAKSTILCDTKIKSTLITTSSPLATSNNFNQNIDNYIILLDKLYLNDQELSELEELCKRVFEKWTDVPSLKQSKIIDALSNKITSTYHLIQFVTKVSHILSAISDTPILKSSQVCDMIIFHLPHLISNSEFSNSDFTNSDFTDILYSIKHQSEMNNLPQLIQSLATLSTMLSNKGKTIDTLLGTSIKHIDKSNDKTNIYHSLDEAINVPTTFYINSQKPSFNEAASIISTGFKSQVKILQQNLHKIVNNCRHLLEVIKPNNPKPIIDNNQHYLAFSLILDSYFKKVDRYFYLSLLFYDRQTDLTKKALDSIRDKTIKKYYCIS